MEQPPITQGMANPIPWQEYPIVVLLIDDQAIVGESVKRLLAGEPDMQFHHCMEPAKALGTAVDLAPKVILLDLVMPGIDGMALLKFLKKGRKTQDIPVIVMSSKDDTQTRTDCFAAGASDYAVKIPSKPELLGRIRAHALGYIHLLQRDEALAAYTSLKNTKDKA